MKLTAAIRQMEVAVMVAKSNRADCSELLNGLKILRTHESQGTGVSRPAGEGENEHGKSPTAPEKPTLVIQWGGSAELKTERAK